MMIRPYFLNFGRQKQTIDMPKRARVLHIYRDGKQIAMDAVQDEDNDTRAFDVKHQRYFEVVATGGACPEGTHIGSVALEAGQTKKDVINAFHIYEVRAR